MTPNDILKTYVNENELKNVVKVYISKENSVLSKLFNIKIKNLEKYYLNVIYNDNKFEKHALSKTEKDKLKSELIYFNVDFISQKKNI